jgi:hypothetical protein
MDTETINGIEYLPWEVEIKDAPMWYRERGLMQTASGYGTKLNTGKKVRWNNRWYRLYCHIISNSGSCYILVKGKRIYYRG